MPRRTATYGRDLLVRFTMHAQSCEMCNATVMAVQQRRKDVPPSCDEGRRLSYEWLEWRVRQGDKQAEIILDRLKEMGANKQ